MIEGVINAGTDQFALQNKQIIINQLKSQIENYEKERAAKMADFDNNSTQLTELKDKLKEMIERTSQLAQTFETKRIEAQEFRDSHNKQISEEPTDGWDQEVPTNVEWPLENANKPNATVTKVKYRCVYAFPARNSDELTIEPGDIVLVCITKLLFSRKTEIRIN